MCIRSGIQAGCPASVSDHSYGLLTFRSNPMQMERKQMEDVKME